MNEPASQPVRQNSRVVGTLAVLVPVILLLLCFAFWNDQEIVLKGKLAQLRASGIPANVEEFEAKFGSSPDETTIWQTVLRRVGASSVVSKGRSLQIIG